MIFKKAAAAAAQKGLYGHFQTFLGQVENI